MTLVPLTLDEARRFTALHHRHNGPPSRWRWGVGLEHDGILVAAGMAGTPKARALAQDDPYLIEIVRVTVADGAPRYACSMVYGALCRAAKALGWQRAVTYTLASEPGSSVRAAGFLPDKECRPRDSAGEWASRGRYETDLFGTPTAPREPKVRWRRDL